jgi:hypothetical protein
MTAARINRVPKAERLPKMASAVVILSKISIGYAASILERF